MSHCFSQAFYVDRLTLVGGVLTPVFAPRVAQSVSLLNYTEETIRIYSCNEDLGEHYFEIASGYERTINTGRSLYTPGVDPAFWLRAMNDGGLVVALWA